MPPPPNADSPPDAVVKATAPGDTCETRVRGFGSARVAFAPAEGDKQ